jgi:predicted Zn-dependent protease
VDRAPREALARRVLALSGTDETEVLVSSEASGLTRFTHNGIHQNVAEADVSVRVRTVVDQRTGVASTNRLDHASLREVVARALAMSRLAPRDEAFPGLPSGGPVAHSEGAFVPATAAATPALRASLAAEVFTVATRAGLWAAGYATTSRSGITVGNSRGVLASFDETDSALNVKQNAADSTGFAERYSHDVGELDAAELASIAARKALDSRAPRAVEPGEWTVILEPAAFGELMSYLGEHFSAQSYDEGSSFLSDGLERGYVGENVTLHDDWSHPLAPGMPFDFEGTPTRPLPLIEHGVARHIVTDSYWAAKLGRPNTGHALPAPNASGPQATHMVIAAGTKTADELVAETPRGLLVSRFWYIRTVDQRQTLVTGMTRDGTFLIEGGRIAAGVRNLRFNQSILAALRRAEFSREQRRTGGYGYSIVVPTVKIERFRFSSATEF